MMDKCPYYEYDEKFEAHICHGCICPKEYVDTCKFEPPSPEDIECYGESVLMGDNFWEDYTDECTGDCGQCNAQFHCSLCDVRG